MTMRCFVTYAQLKKGKFPKISVPIIDRSLSIYAQLKKRTASQDPTFSDSFINELCKNMRMSYLFPAGRLEPKICKHHEARNVMH